MSYRTLNLVPSNVSDANFRAWINEINSALLAFGWVATSDTGQINFSTVTRPTAVSTYQGYAMYRMGDSLQSTTAVFMRLDFGTGANTDAPSMKVQIGIGGTNGSGTITGTVSAQKTIGGDVATTTASFMRTSGTSSSFCMTAWITGQPSSPVNQTFRGIVLAVERDHDSSGADTTAGVCWCYISQAGGGTNAMLSQYIDAAGALATEESRWYGMVTSQSSQSAGGIVGVGPVRCAYGAFRNPMKGILMYSKPDFVAESLNPVVIYGATHNYLMQIPAVTFTASMNGWMTAANSAWGMLWE